MGAGTLARQVRFHPVLPGRRGRAPRAPSSPSSAREQPATEVAPPRSGAGTARPSASSRDCEAAGSVFDPLNRPQRDLGGIVAEGRRMSMGVRP